MSELARILSHSSDIVFFGGAGISTESGIPDFRSSAGLYAHARPGSPPPEYLLSHDCLEQDPQAFFDFHRTSLLHPQARPNRAHLALARLEQAGRLRCVVTQNIDGLHQAAGSRAVLELHGSAHRNVCVGCGRGHGMDFMLATIGVPTCLDCGAMVRPDVVLYGEALDPEVVQGAVEAVSSCDVLVVGGTSLNVYPAAGLVDHFQGSHLVLVNREATGWDHRADLVVHDSLGEVLGQAVDELLD
ncbi:NAD-dependent protein deacylase [Luteococcus sediminum]